MRIAVRYYSRGGATEKVAKAIAREAGERALTQTSPWKRRRTFFSSAAAFTKATLTAT